MINFAHSTFNRIIIHRVNAKLRHEEHSSVEHEDELISADDEAQEIIKSRITEACGRQSKSFKLQIAQIQNGHFFSLAKDTYNLTEADFVERSKTIASLLASSQKRSNIPGGILIVIDGVTDDNMNFVLVVKAELQQAFKTNLNAATRRQQIEVLKDIFLSPAEKFFKIGILRQAINLDETYPNSDYACMIYDDQFRPGGEPAEFFYKDFLGFSIDKNEKWLTKGFFDDAKSIIETHATSYEDKKECIAALRTIYKQDQTGIIDPIDFGDRFLPDNIRGHYASNVLTLPKYSRPFVKDLSLMGRELDRRVMTFRNKVNVIAPEETFDESVTVIKTIEEAILSLEDGGASTLLKINGAPYENA